MINGCVKGLDDCGCSCHTSPGVMHVMPCCDKPRAKGHLNGDECGCFDCTGGVKDFFYVRAKANQCPQCQNYKDEIDRAIYHTNNHVWPGFAGEPGGGDYGGSDF